MKRHDLQKPLIQSALVLLAVFLLIGFIAGSNANSIAGGITSIFKGIFLTILFVVALVIALVISIAVLVGIYLAAVAIYSPQAAGESYQRLRTYLTEYISSWSGSIQARTARSVAARSPSTADKNAPTSSIHVGEKTKIADNQKDGHKDFTTEINTLGSSLSQLREENKSISVAVSELETTIREMPVEEVSATTEKLIVRQEELSTNITDCQAKLEEMNTALQNNEAAMSEQHKQLQAALAKIEALTAEIEDLRSEIKPTEEPSPQMGDEPRIFAYIEDEQHRKQFTDLVDEALAEDMTYAEIDDFLSQSLPKEIDNILKGHPSLTKDFIRNRKNS